MSEGQGNLTVSKKISIMRVLFSSKLSPFFFDYSERFETTKEKKKEEHHSIYIRGTRQHHNVYLVELGIYCKS